MQSFPRFEPGDAVLVEWANAVNEALEAVFNTTGPAVSVGSDGVHHEPAPLAVLVMVVTEAAPSGSPRAHSWSQAKWSGSAWVADDDGQKGTHDGDAPLYLADGGVADVHTLVVAVRTPADRWVGVEAPPSYKRDQTARVVSGPVSGEYVLQPVRYEDTDFEDVGGTLSGCHLVQNFGGETPPAGRLVHWWRNSLGVVEFLPSEPPLNQEVGIGMISGTEPDEQGRYFILIDGFDSYGNAVSSVGVWAFLTGGYRGPLEDPAAGGASSPTGFAAPLKRFQVGSANSTDHPLRRRTAVLWWRSDRWQGRYEFLPLQAATTTLAGLVDIVAQSFAGDKTFVDRLYCEDGWTTSARTDYRNRVGTLPFKDYASQTAASESGGGPGFAYVFTNLSPNFYQAYGPDYSEEAVGPEAYEFYTPSSQPTHSFVVPVPPNPRPTEDTHTVVAGWGYFTTGVGSTPPATPIWYEVDGRVMVSARIQGVTPSLQGAGFPIGGGVGRVGGNTYDFVGLKGGFETPPYVFSTTAGAVGWYFQRPYYLNGRLYATKAEESFDLPQPPTGNGQILVSHPNGAGPYGYVWGPAEPTDLVAGGSSW